METLLDNNEWDGEFFLPAQFEKRFYGRVCFSPENGVELSYTIVGDELPPKSDLLYGVLTSGEKCTLIGPFLPERSAFSIKNNCFSRSGVNGFYFFVLGEFIDQNEKFKEVSFSVSGMQEFFFPKGFKDLVKYSNKPLFQLKTDYGKLRVGNNASFSMLGKDITSQIYNRNEDALSELKDAFEEIDSRHSNSFFMLKKDIAYMITISTNKKSTIQQLYERIEEISHLFAILICAPVYPESIKINHIRAEGHSLQSTVYPSLFLEAKTIGLCKRERSHFHMPITASKIDLVSIIRSWLSASKQYSAIISSLQHETGFRDEHSLHGELVLYATQFEFISHSSGVANQEKYTFPVNKYGTAKIEQRLSDVFQAVDEESYGKGIGDLRNEIAHVGRPKLLLSKLPIRSMVKISQCLRITILGFVLHEMGVEEKIIHEYQNHFTP